MVPAFDVLAEPNRRRILDLLRARERPVGELVADLRISQPAVSKHLRILRDGGFVEVRADGQRRLYRLRSEPLRDLDAWLAPYRQLWASSLDELERHLDAMPDHTHQVGASPSAGNPSDSVRRGRSAAGADLPAADG